MLYIKRNIHEVDDLPRRDVGTAIIGDPRDDENLITSQLHLAFKMFHNALVDHVRKEGLRGLAEVFNEAHRLCRWHYQWMVVHDFLPRIIEQEVINAILPETESRPAEVMLNFYQPKNSKKPMMPVEFAGAAYRFGHSMLPKKYVLHVLPDETQYADLFGPPPSLNGGRPLEPVLKISWEHFFKIPDRGDPVNMARRIDNFLAAPLFNLPFVHSMDPPNSLAERNLLRGKRLGLPSGQRVAQQMGEEVLSNEVLGLTVVPSWKGQTEAPLWFYILKEAELRGNGAQAEARGTRLGAVGGRIVAEVILGLLMLDTDSYLNQNPTFRPERPIARADGVFEIGDLLRFAGAA